MLSASLALVSLVTTLHAQGPAVAVDGHLLPLQADTFAVFAVRGTDTTRTGTVVDVLRRDGDRLVRIYHEVTTTNVQVDTIVSALRDLRPIRYSTHSSQDIADLIFDSTQVRGLHTLADGDTETVASPLPFPVYDGASFDLIVRASQLSDTLQLAVPAFLIGSNTVAPLRGRVIGEATIDGHSCWVFKAAFAGMPVTFWIDKASRALRQQFLQLQVDFGLLYATPPRPRPPTRAT